MTQKPKHKKWVTIMIIIGIATAIDLLVPDPLPLLDEIALIAAWLFAMKKAYF